MSKCFGMLGLALLLSVFTVSTFAACGSDNDSTAAGQPIRATVEATQVTTQIERLTIMASTPIIADWIRQIGGERVQVESLVPAGINPHGFQPGSKTLAGLTKADGVFLVGLGYEGLWMTKLIENNDGIFFTVLGDVIEPIHHGDDEHDEDEEHDEDDEDENHNHSQGNPHFWFDPVRVTKVIDVIAATLTKIDPESSDVYSKNANEYKVLLGELDKEITIKVSNIPTSNRKVMTEHEALIYFTQRYGMESIRSVIPKTSSEAGPTPQDLKRAIEAVRKHDLKIIFVESETNKAAAARVADEAGLKLSDELQVETLNESQSYVDFMKKNINIIVSGLIE